MIACPRCRWENADRSRSCAGCGAPLIGRSAAPADPGAGPTERVRVPPPDPTVRLARPAGPPPGPPPDRTVRVAAPAPPRRPVPPPPPVGMPGPPAAVPPAPRCVACGGPIAPGRRFCRCGAGQPLPPAPTGDTSGAALSARAFRRAQRAANGGAPVGFDAGIGWRAITFRAVLLAVLAALVVSQAGPWGPELRAELAAWITALVPFRF